MSADPEVISAATRAGGGLPASPARTRYAALAAAAVAGLLLAACSGTAGTGADVATTSAPPTLQADSRTAAIAGVEAKRLCDVAGQQFPSEADITADLDKRLSAAGITYLEWKTWHDALATSPSVAAQFAQLAAAAC